MLQDSEGLRKKAWKALEVAANTLKLVAQLRNYLSFHPDDIRQPLQAKSICPNVAKVSQPRLCRKNGSDEYAGLRTK